MIHHFYSSGNRETVNSGVVTNDKSFDTVTCSAWINLRVGLSFLGNRRRIGPLHLAIFLTTVRVSNPYLER